MKELFVVMAMWKKKNVKGGVIAGKLFFTSGTASYPEKPGDTETQIRQTMENLKKSLENAGTSMENVVKGTVFLQDLNDRERYLNKIWAEYFPENRPARTCIGGVDIGNYSVEIELVAVIPEKK